MLPVEAHKLVTGENVKTVVKLSRHLGMMEDDVDIKGKKVFLSQGNSVQEYTPQNVFDSETSILYLHESVMESYINAFIEGFNVSVIVTGSSNSEKGRLLEGTRQHDGLIELFMEETIRKLEAKQMSFNEKGKQASWSLRFSACEIADESVSDLLGGPGCKAEIADWEGPKIGGASAYAIKSFSKFKETLNNSKIRRTKFVSEFGPLIHKSCAHYSIDLTQVIDDVLLVSKLVFMELPALDCLTQDRQKVVRKDGVTINKSIFAFEDILEVLGGGQPGGIPQYEASVLTTLLKDALGGNCFTLNFSCITQGDTDGSFATLKIMNMLDRVTNYPILNEGNLLGLLRKYRLEVRRAREYAGREYGDRKEDLELRFIDLEKKVVEENINKIKGINNSEKLARQVGQLHEQYKTLKRQNDMLKADLIKSEEEKLKLTDCLLELQVENSHLQSEVQNANYDASYKIVGHETELINLKTKEEQAIALINDLKEALEMEKEEKEELETELVVIRKNYANLNIEFEKKKTMLQELEIEYININNEKIEMEKELYQISNKFKSQEHALNDGSFKQKEIQKEYDRTREALIEMKKINEELQAKLIREDTRRQEFMLDMKTKQFEMQQGFFEVNKKKQQELENLNMNEHKKREELEKEKIVKESEKREYMAKNRALTRKLEELTKKFNDINREYNDLKDNHTKQTILFDESRNNYRSKLIGYIEGDNNNFLNAREDLIRNYAERESELLEKLEDRNFRIKKLKEEYKALKEYTVQIKYLAEDWMPVGAHFPEILLKREPFTLIEHKNEKNKDNYNTEKRLRERNERLERDLLQMQKELANIKQRYDSDILERQETDKEKTLEEQNKRLKEEVSKLTVLAHEKDNTRTLYLERENEKLRFKVKRFEEKHDQPGNMSSDTHNLQKRIDYYQRKIHEMEIERSQLLSRANLAEQKLKVLEENHSMIIRKMKNEVRAGKEIYKA